ncbi:DUF4856 domain-containing protein [Algoriphagus aestuarii]|nr:DUF4856 domain-containing protein [Algoriphagus aestuarii]
MKNLNFSKIILGTAALFATVACNSDEENPNLRLKMEYSAVSTSKGYSEQFVDVDGNTTVHKEEGTLGLEMFKALNYYITNSVSSGVQIDASLASSIASNSGTGFLELTGSDFNLSALTNADFSLMDRVASSRSSAETEAAKTNLELLFARLEEASKSLNVTAEINQAGKLGNYLLDEQGIELAQVLQKSLIGAFQLDYIGNVLLTSGLSADNNSLVSAENYTALEHNWDIAYGMLTQKEIYLEGYTDSQKGEVTEFGLGAYLWEYNKAGYPLIYPAFLKGRVAIINNDFAEVEKQAKIIREEMEKALANAALGYLGKWRTGTSDDKRAHAIAEGIGFIYSLRYATTFNADAAFSDLILLNLVGSANGFWDLDASKISEAESAIKAKFNIQ